MLGDYIVLERQRQKQKLGGGRERKRELETKVLLSFKEIMLHCLNSGSSYTLFLYHSSFLNLRSDAHINMVEGKNFIIEWFDALNIMTISELQGWGPLNR